MRIAAIFLNIVQILIILWFYFTMGLSLGEGALLSLFILLLIASINVLVHLFYSPLNVAPAQDSAESGKLVKRQDLRVLYNGELRPTLQWAKRQYPVIDMSKNGLRILINEQEKTPKRFRGRLTLLSGKVLPLRLTLLRREGGQAALLMKTPIAIAIIEDEKQQLTNLKNAVCLSSTVV